MLPCSFAVFPFASSWSTFKNALVSAVSTPTTSVEGGPMGSAVWVVAGVGAGAGGLDMVE